MKRLNLNLNDSATSNTIPISNNQSLPPLRISLVSNNNLNDFLNRSRPNSENDSDNDTNTQPIKSI